MKPWTKDAKLLRQAAALVVSGEYNRSCLAIDRVVEAKTRSSLRGRYAATMLGGEQNPYRMEWPGGVDSAEAQDVRALLLCFAADLALTGDLRRHLNGVVFGHECRKHPAFGGMRYFSKGDPSKIGSCVACTDLWCCVNRKTPAGRFAACLRVKAWREKHPEYRQNQRALYQDQQATNRSKYA